MRREGEHEGHLQWDVLGHEHYARGRGQKMGLASSFPSEGEGYILDLGTRSLMMPCPLCLRDENGSVSNQPGASARLQNSWYLHLVETMLFMTNSALRLCDSKIFNSSKEGLGLDCKGTLLEGKAHNLRLFLFLFYFSVDVPVYLTFLFLPAKHTQHFHACWLKCIGSPALESFFLLSSY